jgi:hypothetical protein
MSKQYNKLEKRQRRLAYLKRRKTAVKAKTTSKGGAAAKAEAVA